MRNHSGFLLKLKGLDFVYWMVVSPVPIFLFFLYIFNLFLQILKCPVITFIIWLSGLDSKLSQVDHELCFVSITTFILLVAVLAILLSYNVDFWSFICRLWLFAKILLLHVSAWAINLIFCNFDVLIMWGPLTIVEVCLLHTW